jgi:hypothetical protein
MRKVTLEKSIVVLLFILVLIVFSFAERDTQKLYKLYNGSAESFEPLKKEKNLASSEPQKAPFFYKSTRN